MSKSLKTNSINITNNLSTQGSLNFSDGYQFMDNSYDTNNGLPKNFQFGTSNSQGNTLRDNFNLNNNGPIEFGRTDDDTTQLINRYPLIIKEFPISSAFPWLYPITRYWSQNTQTLLDSSSSEVPISKCLGKGIGEIDIYKVGRLSQGSQEKAGSSSKSINGITITTKTQSPYIDSPIYPQDGNIYSGTLVEVISQLNPETGKKETVVIPFQNGRGIPNYYTVFQPENSQKIGNFLPWGPMEWPESGEKISPFLSPGVEPNRQTSIYGIVMDSYSSQSYKDRPFKSRVPDNITDEREPWFNHPAPHTIPPTSFKGIIPGDTKITQGFLSPGPNTASTFWSPWPKQFAYKPDDPVPIMTKGITTARIGAAYNIALSSYGISSYISATDKSWVPVGIIPLFQGERLEAGSLIYGAVKGQIQTPGPNVIYQEAIDDNDFKTLGTGFIGQNIWDLNIDTTWGNIGWCGTPGLCFHNIPDNGVTAIETLGAGVMPYLNQSNQGSIIVQGITSVSPYPGLGNSYNIQTNSQTESEFNDIEKYEILKERFKLDGISGRSPLSQMAPEKAQPIGVLMETIVGTGKWEYDGLPINPPVNSDIIKSSGGVSYSITYTSNIPTRTQLFGSGIGLECSWINFNINNYGQITQSPEISAPGSGYTYGDVITVNGDSLDYWLNPQYKNNNASYLYDNTFLRILVPNPGGNNYGNSLENKRGTINMSRNSIYMSFEDDGSGGLVHDNFGAPIAPDNDYPQGFSRYTIGDIVRVISYDNKYHESAIFAVIGVDDIAKNYNLSLIYSGNNYLPTTGYKYFETEDITYTHRAPYITYDTYGTNSSITNIEYLDYGVGNDKGDIILAIDDPVYGSTGGNACGENATFEYGQIPAGFQTVSAFAPWYPADGANIYNTINVNNQSALSLDIKIIQDDKRLFNNEYIPCFIYPTPATAPHISSIEYNIYKLQYSDNLPGGATSMASPWYFGNSFSVWTSKGNLLPLIGGSSYKIGLNIPTYNMSANTLRVPLTIVNGLITDTTLVFSITDTRYFFNTVRYSDGDEFRIMSDIVDEEFQAVFKYKGFDGIDVTIEVVSQGINYELPDGTYLFQTQKTNQVNPEVDIEFAERIFVTQEPNKGQIRKLKLSSSGSGNFDDDILLVLQESSDFNGFFMYKNNMEYVNLPPYATKNGYLVDSSEDAWEKYNGIMKSATNLLDKEVLIEIRPNQGQYMDNILPSGQQYSPTMPYNENPYRYFYPK